MIKHSLKRIKRFVNETAYLVPIILLVVSFTAVFIDYYAIKNGGTILGNTCGYSLVVDYAFLKFYTFRKHYCYFTRLSPIGLIIINTIDIIACFLGDDFYDLYSFWYTIIISSIIFGLVGILEIRKRINKW